MSSWLTSLAIFAVVLDITTAAHPRFQYSPTSTDNSVDTAENDVCVESKCYDLVRKFEKSMDLAVNPCDDFHQYTCGNLFKKSENLNKSNFTNQFDILQESLNNQLKSVLDAKDKKNDTRHVKLTKALYKSCMNLDAIEKKRLEPLQNLIQTHGGWPVLDGLSWDESKFDWMTTVAEWKLTGLSGDCFMPLRVETDVKNTSRNVIAVNEPGYDLSWDNLNEGFNNSDVKAYYKYMVDVAVLLGAEEQLAKDELKEVILFHIDLNKIVASVEESEKRDKRYHIMTLKELIERYPLVEWRNILRKMYAPTHTFLNDEPILVPSPEYVENMIELMSKTKKRVQANYAMWQNIAPLFDAMNQDIRNRRDVYEGIRDGKTKVHERWTECLQQVKTRMGLSLGAMYVKQFLNPKTKPTMEDITEKIKEELLANVNKISFMDEATKAYVKNKEKSIKKVIGYPKEIQDDNKLDDYYRDLELSDNDYFSNLLNLGKFYFQVEVDSLRKSPREDNWLVTGPAVTYDVPAFFPSYSTVLIPAPVLHWMFFEPKSSSYINFGNIGWLIGYEMHNSIYNYGSSFDENGNFNASWPPTVKNLFDQQRQCFISQSNNYFKNTFNLTLNGLLNNDVIIAHAGGLKNAYHAYVKSSRGKGEQRLPRFNFTPNQLFWIAAGNMMCDKKPTNAYGVIGAILNNEAFAKDFNCPLGSKMNPAKKCPVW